MSLLLNKLFNDPVVVEVTSKAAEASGVAVPIPT